MYQDFVKYFWKIDISYQINSGANYVYEEIFLNGKNAVWW
jgi:hypothetical protein